MPFIVPSPRPAQQRIKDQLGQAVPASVPEKLSVPMTRGHVGRALARHEVHACHGAQVQVLIYCPGLATQLLATRISIFGNL